MILQTLGEGISLFEGDCRELLASLPDVPYSDLHERVLHSLDNARMHTSETKQPYISLPPMEGDYGYLTIVEKTGSDARGNRMVRCRCICGNVKEYRLANLKSGKTVSCGCMKNLLIAAKQSTHNASVPESDCHHLYVIWKSLGRRRRKSNYTETSLIGVDESWKNWIAFKEWSLSHGYDEGKRLVRTDANKPYGPDNCLWVVRSDEIFRSLGSTKQLSRTAETSENVGYVRKQGRRS